MNRKYGLKKRQFNILFYTGLFALVMVGFNNCSQPGALTVIPGEKLGSSSTPTDPTDNPPGGNPPGQNPPTNPEKKYVSKSKMVTVNSADNNKVDLLVVVDNSSSMGTEQANMAARFSTLIDQLQGLDWQVGVITTDVSSDANLKDGRLIAMDTAGSQFIINSQMDINRAKEDFARVIQRKESGSGNEQGIKATYRALERALNSANATVDKPNRDLIRPDAAFAVLVVTDANETPKTADTRNKGDNLINFVTNSYGGKKNFIFNSIIVKSGDSACKAKDGNESYGVAYEDISQKTDGIIGTVCAVDYGSQLKLIGDKVVDQVKSIQLDCAPVDSNGDGKLDVGVFEVTSTVGVTPAVLGRELQGYVIQGRNLVFSDYLPEGSFQAKYVCEQSN